MLPSRHYDNDDDIGDDEDLLWYHIVPGTYYSEGLEAGQWLSTLHGVGRLRVELTRQNRTSNECFRVTSSVCVASSLHLSYGALAFRRSGVQLNDPFHSLLSLF